MKAFLLAHPYSQSLLVTFRPQRGTLQPLKRSALVLTLALSIALCAGCSTTYYAYSGSGIYQGQGGASKRVNGIDLWVVGTPPRKFRIVGYITDSRPGGPIPMATRDGQMAAAAKKNGGDALLLNADERDFMGSYSTANAMAISNGNVTTATGSGISVPIFRREARYYVIKFVN
jgi:hypothetical protein